MRTFKCECQQCGGRIEFPVETLGECVTCPHCGQDTHLVLAEANDVTAAYRRTRVWAIGGIIVLVALLAAAMVSVHLLRRLAPRARQARAMQLQHAHPSQAASATPSSAQAHATATAGTFVPPADWWQTNALALSPIELVAEQDRAPTHATGTLVNLAPRRRFELTVELQLLDESGHAVGQTSDSRAELEPFGEWTFRAPVTAPSIKSARVVAIRERR